MLEGPHDQNSSRQAPVRDQNQAPILQSTPTQPVQSLLLGSTPTARSSFPRTKLSPPPGHTSMPTTALLRLTLSHCHLSVVRHPPYGEFVSLCPAGFVCSPIVILVYAWDVSVPVSTYNSIIICSRPRITLNHTLTKSISLNRQINTNT